MPDDLAAAKAAKYIGLFETPVIVAQIPDAVFLTGELRGIIEERRAQHPSAQRSNRGGWQSDNAMLDWGGEPAKELGAMLVQMCSKFTRDIGQTDANKPRFEWSGEMWANVCPRGGSHESHTHPGSLWSAVFFLDNGLAENEEDSRAGYLVLQDPRNPVPLMYKPDLRYIQADGSVYRSDHRFTPKPGQVVAFPAWLAHWVTPHQGQRERISIALNVFALPARIMQSPS
ncbi:MAG: TIGR02466 family protein [Gammaproteobacteria bacterium]|nr:TIGR02466 family protein [Gammaproteobacteria bacterium]